jgi:hypothetical protein
MREVFRRKWRRMAKRHMSARSQKNSLNLDSFNRFNDLHPLVGPQTLTDLIAMDRELRSTSGKWIPGAV